MADKIVFKGVHPSYDGEYEIEDDFTMRELHTIKRLSGCRVAEIQDALAQSDTDVVLALGVIVLQRHGKHIDEDVLWDTTAGSISLVGEDAVPPPISEPLLEQSGSTSSSSGTDSTDSSESPENGQSPTGLSHLGTSDILESVTSAS